MPTSLRWLDERNGVEFKLAVGGELLTFIVSREALAEFSGCSVDEIKGDEALDILRNFKVDVQRAAHALYAERVDMFQPFIIGARDTGLV